MNNPQDNISLTICFLVLRAWEWRVTSLSTEKPKTANGNTPLPEKLLSTQIDFIFFMYLLILEFQEHGAAALLDLRGTAVLDKAGSLCSKNVEEAGFFGFICDLHGAIQPRDKHGSAYNDTDDFETMTRRAEISYQT